MGLLYDVKKSFLTFYVSTFLRDAKMGSKHYHLYYVSMLSLLAL